MKFSRGQTACRDVSRKRVPIRPAATLALEFRTLTGAKLRTPPRLYHCRPVTPSHPAGPGKPGGS